MAVLERTYNIPLRKEFSHSPHYRRTNRAMRALRTFLEKHMKSDDVKIGKHLNELIWKHSLANPPHHVKVNVRKSDDNAVVAELVGFPFEEKKDAKKQAKKTELKKPESPKMPDEAAIKKIEEQAKAQAEKDKAKEALKKEKAEEKKEKSKEAFEK